jgi:tetratricopeptide (TPR) repeat protein
MLLARSRRLHHLVESNKLVATLSAMMSSAGSFCAVACCAALFCAAVVSSPQSLLAAPLAPDEVDPDTAAASDADLLDPTLPSKQAIEKAQADEPRSLAPPQTEAAPLKPDRPGAKTATPTKVRPAAGEKDANQEPGPGEPMVRRAFEMSKTKRDEEGLTEVIDLCNAGIEAGLTGAMVPYTRQFMGWAHNRRGELRADAEHNIEALEDFGTAVRLDDTKWRHYHNRGVSLATLAKYDEAIADFDQTIKMNPNYANAYFNRGELRYEKQEFAAAIADYTHAIRLAPKDAAAFNSRGHAHYKLKHFREAMEDYNQAVRLDPTAAAAYTNRGDAYADLGQYAEAAHDYRAAIKQNPKLGRAYQSAAWLMATCPDENFRSAELAVQAAEKAIALDGDTDYHYVETLAAAQASAGDFDAAISTQKKANELVPAEQQQRAADRLAIYEKHNVYREAPFFAPKVGDTPPLRPLDRF